MSTLRGYDFSSSMTRCEGRKEIFQGEVFGSIVALEKGIIKEEVVRIDRWVDVVGLSRVDNWW